MSKPVAIVTGAGSGIGEAVATHLISVGYKVVIADLNVDSGTRVATALGPDAIFHQTDVSSYESQARLFKRAYEWGGNRLDFCHANAGIDDRQNIFAGREEEEVDEEGLVKKLSTKTLEVNLEAVLQGLWLFNYMPQCPQYTASKYAIIGLVRASAPAFLKESITVNAICPAFIPTNLCPPEILARWPKEHITPLTTVIKAIDAFLGDDQLTGQAVELSQDNIYFRKQVEYANESQRWMGEESGKIWDMGYEAPPKRTGY
ncbi:15-hydroxyprostaglandin dehydrogenase [Pyrenophora tritici-repentis]|uniref:15-hydroxyprostaglandin dehydrogenase n=1 Tax=Pyrenophora tritici-repentis TaxID=45151 RepID=A0A2W1EHT5_9PLEO|nr:15-hydroxyprostaglandin dehydrogenase [Pyrenophora tritici-repentis]KAI1515043.1 15-hydroxyprostaglandin dehydrogenase [Pyrenophora tritici-repentis]KAI1530735.1 FabG Dehydrogenase with different specificities related to short-chain alcohol dehydrogenase [Pyrenophora tritici-repentis]KAI1565296.1 FabG Dehydrogenase with different specificities related to short-chain alcohol dehydrogenase [Pyrenophora tritici-repentis]KAI1585236.1 FabG Dehydrogenase with different specificities related to sho